MADGPVLIVNASLRAGSFTAALGRAAAATLEATHPVTLASRMAELPFYNADLDTDTPPEPVAVERATVAAAAGIVVCTPQYNGSVPGALKNWLDWMTRPPQGHVLTGKPVLVIGGSPAKGGAKMAHDWLQMVLGYLGGSVPEAPLSVPFLHERLVDGAPDEALQEELAGKLASWWAAADRPG